MSFKVNSSQQISFNDSVFSLTAREKKALDNSWAKIFADEIFPNIDEERFSVLYSSKASRPNAPVNVIIGALIIKELFDYSDDEIVENLMLVRAFCMTKSQVSTIRNTRKVWNYYDFTEGLSQKAVLI